jgi:hypothetical protein
MTTKNVVADGRVLNELLGSMHRKMHEIVRRTDEGTLDPQWVINQLQAIVEGRGKSIFPIWKTSRLGTGFKTGDDFRSGIKEGGNFICGLADNILDESSFTVSEAVVSVDLVNVSVSDLGFKYSSARLVHIFAMAFSLGLELCPAEMGPRLCLHYGDQSKGERFFIAMEPIIYSGGPACVFGVECDHDGLWLITRSADLGSFWNPDERFVFVRPRK